MGLRCQLAGLWLTFALAITLDHRPINNLNRVLPVPSLSALLESQSDSLSDSSSSNPDGVIDVRTLPIPNQAVPMPEVHGLRGLAFTRNVTESNSRVFKMQVDSVTRSSQTAACTHIDRFGSNGCAIYWDHQYNVDWSISLDANLTQGSLIVAHLRVNDEWNLNLSCDICADSCQIQFPVTAGMADATMWIPMPGCPIFKNIPTNDYKFRIPHGLFKQYSATIEGEVKLVNSTGHVIIGGTIKMLVNGGNVEKDMVLPRADWMGSLTDEVKGKRGDESRANIRGVGSPINRGVDANANSGVGAGYMPNAANELYTGDPYIATWILTGCPNTAVSAMSFGSPGNDLLAKWKDGTVDAAMADMLLYCTANNDGSATTEQKHQCCGDYECPTPLTCVEQTTLASPGENVEKKKSNILDHAVDLAPAIVVTHKEYQDQEMENDVLGSVPGITDTRGIDQNGKASYVPASPLLPKVKSPYVKPPTLPPSCP